MNDKEGVYGTDADRCLENGTEQGYTSNIVGDIHTRVWSNIG